MAYGFYPYADAPYGYVGPEMSVSPTYSVVRLSSRGYTSRNGDSPSSTLYRAGLLSDITIGQSVADSAFFGGGASLAWGDILIANHDGSFDATVLDSSIDCREFRVRLGTISDYAKSDLGFSLPDVSHVGRISGWTPTSSSVSLALGDIISALDVDLQNNRYSGDGGTSGVANLSGKPKPICIGMVRNVSPVYVGQVDLGVGVLPTYQTHWRSIDGHLAVYERGVIWERTSGTPVAGQWRDWPSIGMFQLGGTPDSSAQITCDCRGDNVGGYASSVFGVMQRMISSLGNALGTSIVDSASGSVLDYSVAGEIGWFQGAEVTTLSAAIDAVARATGVWSCGSRDGKVRFSAIGSYSEYAQFALDSGDIISINPAKTPSSLWPPPRQVEVGYSKNWTSMTSISSSIVGDDRSFLEGPGKRAVARSNLITTSYNTPRTMQIEGLFAEERFAQARADDIMAFIERGPRAFVVTTDKYLGQIEIGMTGDVVYPDHRMSSGWRGVVVGYREVLGKRVEITMIG